MVPERAPVGPTILNLLPPKIAAIRPAQMAVMMPALGDEFDATASDIDSGIETRATLNPARQFSFNLFMIMVLSQGKISLYISLYDRLSVFAIKISMFFTFCVYALR